MAFVYILYSLQIDQFYIGSCLDLEERLIEHNSHLHSKSNTRRANDWSVFYKCKNLEYETARKIEFHIKKMKSRVSNENLLKYDDIMKKLIEKHNVGSSR